MHIQGRSESGHLHVIGPLARLPHLLDMVFELLLQLLLGVVGGIDTSVQRSGGLAFGIPPYVVHSHVLTVEIRVVSHVLNSRRAQYLIHFLVAIELVGQGVEEAVAVTSYLTGIQSIGLEYGEFR